MNDDGDNGVSAPDLHCGRPSSHMLQPSSRRFDSTLAQSAFVLELSADSVGTHGQETHELYG